MRKESAAPAYNGAYSKYFQQDCTSNSRSESDSVPYSESHPVTKEFPIRLELKLLSPGPRVLSGSVKRERVHKTALLCL